MNATLTTIRSGNSVVVTLPDAWLHARGIEVGVKLNASFSDNGALVLDKLSDSEEDDVDRRKKAFADVMRLAHSMPPIPWEDDSREADRALVAERYL